MHRHKAALALILITLISASPILAQQAAVLPANNQPELDPTDAITRIKEEGLKRSQVMETLSYLSDVIGPRLTGSPNMKRANEWTQDQLTKWGLRNSHLEPWGPFGRGWVLKSFSAEVIAPQAIPLIAFPKAWSPGAEISSAEVVYFDAKDEADFTRFKGQLRGKIVLIGDMRSLVAQFEPQAKRLTEKQLLGLADAGGQNAQEAAGQVAKFQGFIKSLVLQNKQLQFISDEGAALLVFPTGDGGTLFVDAAWVPQDIDVSSPLATLRSLLFGKQPFHMNVKPIVPQIVLASDQYNRLLRMIKAGEKLTMKASLVIQFTKDAEMGFNTIAEIPGSDKADEIVMIGGHLDSWHAGTGATDNAAGVAAAMEAVRIIQALGLKPRRTIRIGLWGGEEQGLLGSEAHVNKYFGKPLEETKDQTIMRLVSGSIARKISYGPEYDKLSAYYNLDNGTGKIRGVYLQGNEAVRPIFRQWLQPLRDLGATTLTASNTSGTDHLSFDTMGLPGFQFIQDQIEYSTRTHHTNLDTFDRVQADDLKQAAIVMAVFVYNTAMLEEKLPRKKAP